MRLIPRAIAFAALAAALLLAISRLGVAPQPGVRRISVVQLAPADGAAPHPAESAQRRRERPLWDWRPHGDGHDL